MKYELDFGEEDAYILFETDQTFEVGQVVYLPNAGYAQIEEEYEYFRRRQRSITGQMDTEGIRLRLHWVATPDFEAFAKLCDDCENEETGMTAPKKWTIRVATEPELVLLRLTGKI
jgi:hypothetical protein